MILPEHNLMGASEIGELFGVGRQRVQQFTKMPDFPKPLADLAMGKVWQATDIRAWGIKEGRITED